MSGTQNEIGQEVFNLPMGEMIRNVAMAVADAQFQLDKSSMVVAEFMSGQRLVRNMDTGELVDPENRTPQDTRIFFGYTYKEERDSNGQIKKDEAGNPIMVRTPNKVSMMELGFVPNFYQFADTVIEMKLTMRIHKQSQNSAQNNDLSTGDYLTTVAPMDAGYSSSYNFSAEMATTVKTKIVPIPPPVALEERVKQLTDQAGRELEKTS